MSAYLGYRLIIDGITIPENMIVKKSYGATPKERRIYAWTDANQKAHYDISPVPKMDIEFTFRHRKLAEHEAYLSAFESFENKYLTYWDDKSCTYKEGLFKMDRPQFVSYVEGNELYYAETAIHLEEY